MFILQAFLANCLLLPKSKVMVWKMIKKESKAKKDREENSTIHLLFVLVVADLYF